MKKIIFTLALLFAIPAFAWPPQTIIATQNGLLGLKGINGVNNEYMVMDFETSANEVGFFSVSGVSRFRFDGMGLQMKELLIKEDLPTLTGGQDYVLFPIILGNQNHTGVGNTLYGIKFKDMKLDADAFGTAIEVGQGWHVGLHLVENLPILFGDPLNSGTPGTMLYHDGTILSIDKDLKIYGDLVMNWTAIRNVEVIGLRRANLTPGACPIQDEWVIDDGGATEELCVCNGRWKCSPMPDGPMN